MAADKKSKKKQKEKPPIKIATPPDKVYQCVVSAPKPLTTSEIAQKTGLDSKKVYRICTPLEKKGLLEKVKKPREKPLFFSLIIRQIMHAGNHDLITTLNTELRIIIRKNELRDPRMERALRKFFANMLRTYPQYRNAINSGMERLIGTINRTNTKDEVLELLGLRPSYPEVCIWKPGPGH